jgi:inorganic pyrophosphatase
MDSQFWNYLEQLVAENEIVIDRPQGSAHPRYAELIYPLDYGYLAGTTAGDGQGIDVWLGSGERRAVSGIVCTVDLQKRDTEIKLLLGCSVEEMWIVEQFHNAGSFRCMAVGRESGS